MGHATGAKRLWRIGACVAGFGLAFSLLAYPPSAFSRPRKQGATIALYCGTKVVKGELIGIRADAIVVLSEKMETAVPIADVDKVRVSQGFNKTGSIIGALAGGIAALAIAGPHKPRDISANSLNEAFSQGVNESINSMVRDFAVASAGGLAGGLLGGSLTKDRVIQLRGRSEAEIEVDLNKLRKKARVPDYR